MKRDRVMVGKNDMLVSVGVPFNDRPTQLHISAHGTAATDPLPMLRKAIAAIQAEIDAYPNCPVHRARAT